MEVFLKSRYGESQGEEILKKQQTRLKELITQTTSKSKEQMKTLSNVILPRIALYQVLQEVPMEKEEAYKVVKDYLVEVVCKKMKKKLLLMENIPFFRTIFRGSFCRAVLGSDHWEAKMMSKTKESFTLHISKCLWYDTCVENGCPELCKAFCECDDINFGELKKLEFIRNGAIGLGKDRCDFTFKVRRKK